MEPSLWPWHCQEPPELPKSRRLGAATIASSSLPSQQNHHHPRSAMGEFTEGQCSAIPASVFIACWGAPSPRDTALPPASPVWVILKQPSRNFISSFLHRREGSELPAGARRHLPCWPWWPPGLAAAVNNPLHGPGSC